MLICPLKGVMAEDDTVRLRLVVLHAVVLPHSRGPLVQTPLSCCTLDHVEQLGIRNVVPAAAKIFVNAMVEIHLVHSRVRQRMFGELTDTCECGRHILQIIELSRRCQPPRLPLPGSHARAAVEQVGAAMLLVEPWLALVATVARRRAPLGGDLTQAVAPDRHGLLASIRELVSAPILPLECGRVVYSLAARLGREGAAPGGDGARRARATCAEAAGVGVGAVGHLDARPDALQAADAPPSVRRQ
mmetsp:Transcript_93923/g.235804  ORF Transcript_93923/g.235804 Transcript_93923/m.235804 type:complete len:245 (-) Transcript_93923:322-1056(-)